MLHDMSMSMEEKRDFSTPREAPEAPKYPYGLSIHLGPEELKKLGFMSPPKVGDKMMMMAKVFVKSVSMKESDDKDMPQDLGFSVDLQIAGMALKGEEKDESPSSVIYGE